MCVPPLDLSGSKDLKTGIYRHGAWSALNTWNCKLHKPVIFISVDVVWIFITCNEKSPAFDAEKNSGCHRKVIQDKEGQRMIDGEQVPLKEKNLVAEGII